MAHDPDERQAFHIGDDGLQPVGPGHDPDYPQRLMKHPSGSRYRAEIRRVLGVTVSRTDWNR